MSVHIDVMELDGATAVSWCVLHLSNLCSYDILCGGTTLVHVHVIHVVPPVAHKQDQSYSEPPSETDDRFNDWYLQHFM